MINSIAPIERLRCMKILPLVYDDSLSYYEAICKFQAKLNEVIEAMSTISVDVLAEANAYTDSKIAEQQSAIDRVVEEMEALIQQTEQQLREIIDSTSATFDQKIALLDTRYTEFTQAVNAQLVFFNNRLNELAQTIENDIIGVNARTDLAIQQNNEYIFEQIEGRVFENVKVLNMFTGQLVSVQDMFNYLGNLHIEHGINYTQIAGKNKTISYIVALNATYTQLAINGALIIV